MAQLKSTVVQGNLTVTGKIIGDVQSSGGTSMGSVTSVTVQGNDGLTGSGTITSSGTITLSHGNTSDAANLTANGRTYVTGLTFDNFGHVTAYTTGTETVTNTNTTYTLSKSGSSIQLKDNTGAVISTVTDDNTTNIPARLGVNTNGNTIAPDSNYVTGFAYASKNSNPSTATGLPANVTDASYITLSYDGSSWSHQLLFKFDGTGISGTGYDGKDIYTRCYHGTNKKWSDWHVILTSGNVSNILNNTYLPLAGGTMTEAGPIKYNQGAGDKTYKNNYISAGRGYSPGSGRYGIKIVACDQNDCVSGLGQDLLNGSAQTLPYDFGVAGSASTSNQGYISFCMHKYSGTNGSAASTEWETTAKTYHRVGIFDYSGKFGTRSTICAPGIAITSGDATNCSSSSWSPSIKATWQYNSSTDCIELVW